MCVCLWELCVLFHMSHMLIDIWWLNSWRGGPHSRGKIRKNTARQVSLEKQPNALALRRVWLSLLIVTLLTVAL